LSIAAAKPCSSRNSCIVLGEAGVTEPVKQNFESNRDRDRGNGIAVGGGRACATNAKSVQSSLRHFARAVERLQEVDSNRMGENPIIDHVTQDLASDLRGIWSARDLAKANVQGSKDLPVLLHGKGSKGKLRRQVRQRRDR
jgi:hypothetical protein